MNRDSKQSDSGIVKIHRNVVASIAAIAAIEIEGVKRVGGNLASGILGIIGKSANFAIKVEFDKNEEARITLPLVIKYGYNIPEVADKVQENVRTALEKMTSLDIKDINISVQGIEK